MNQSEIRPLGIPDDWVPKPRICPCPGHDIAIGDIVFWRGHEHLGALSIGSMHYLTEDLKPAASCWTGAADAETRVEDKQQHIAPLSELRVMDDCQWWGSPDT